MKKILTLTTGLFLAVVMVSAAPIVTIYTPSDYEITVDGKRYWSTNGNAITITDLNTGNHTVKVYGISTGIFKTKKLISSSTFQLYENNVRIDIDRNGNINVRESQVGGTRPGSTTYPGSDDRRSDDPRYEDREHENRSYRRSRGKGHKYGHNKDWKKSKNKAKKSKDYDDDDDDDDDDKVKDQKKENKGSQQSDDNRWKRTNRRSTKS